MQTGQGLLAEVDASNDATYPLADALGTVRTRTDDTGAVIGSAEYDAFGNLRSNSGTQGAFGWTGELRDPTTGLTYLRARDYASGVGGFLTRDTVNPSGPGTQGYNVYAYAGNNPVTLADPSGHAAAALSVYLAAAKAQGATAESNIGGGPPRAQMWAFETLALIAVVLNCLRNELCRADESAVTGSNQEAVAVTVGEAAKTWSVAEAKEWLVEWQRTEPQREPQDEPQSKPTELPPLPPTDRPDQRRENCSKLNYSGLLPRILWGRPGVSGEHVLENHSYNSTLLGRGRFTEAISNREEITKLFQYALVFRVDPWVWRTSKKSCMVNVDVSTGYNVIGQNKEGIDSSIVEMRVDTATNYPYLITMYPS